MFPFVCVCFEGYKHVREIGCTTQIYTGLVWMATSLECNLAQADASIILSPDRTLGALPGPSEFPRAQSKTILYGG